MESEHVRALEELDENKIVIPAEPQGSEGASESEFEGPETLPDPEFEEKLLQQQQQQEGEADVEEENQQQEGEADEENQQQEGVQKQPLGSASATMRLAAELLTMAQEQHDWNEGRAAAGEGLRAGEGRIRAEGEEVDGGGDSSSEWSDSDDEALETIDLADRSKLTALLDSIRMMDDGEDYEAEDGGGKVPPRTKNEIPLELQPLPDLSGIVIPADEHLPVLGEVLSVVQTLAVIQGEPGFEGKPLAPGSILCLRDRRLVGAVHEIFGPIVMPFYSVRFATPEAARELLREGLAVHFVPSLAKHAEPILAPGTDASGLYDEELEEDEWFSDDEQEAEAKRKRKQKGKAAGDQPPENSRDAIPSGSGAQRSGRRGGHQQQGSRGGKSQRGGRPQTSNQQPQQQPQQQQMMMGMAGTGMGMGFPNSHPQHQVQMQQLALQQQQLQAQFQQQLLQQQQAMMMAPGAAYPPQHQQFMMMQAQQQQQQMLMHLNQPPMMMFPGGGAGMMYPAGAAQGGAAAAGGLPVAFGGFAAPPPQGQGQWQSQQQPPRP